MIGQRIHSYEINAHLGAGGMGNVFKATDNMLGREVALKMLHPQLTVQPQFLDRFKKEARILAQLLHPNIAVIYNFIEQGGNHFMVMEYVEGISLDDLLKKYGVLPAEFVVPVFIQALEGLQHAHKKNVFHRDIKPANLMITDDATLKLMDFGIAKVAGEQKMTQVNKIVGTLEFMAPELIEGKDASALSDIYAAGATLYELVCGKVPFEADTDFNLMQAILKSKLRAPDKINPAVPKALSDIVLKAMDRNPEHRYNNARAFQQDLVKAFPNFREIDMQVLKRIQPGSSANQRTAELKPTALMDQAGTSKTARSPVTPVKTLQAYGHKVRSNRKAMVAILCLLVIAIGTFAVVSMKNNENAGAITAQNDSMKQPVVQNTAGRSDSASTTQAEITTTTLPTDNRIPVITEPAAEPDEPRVLDSRVDKRSKGDAPLNDKGRRSTVKDEMPVKQGNVKNTGTSEATPKVPDTKVEEEPPVTKTPEKKEINITSEVMVPLALVGMPDMNQKKKEEQRVSFTVMRPVYYDGVIIISQGAKASGSLTIGRSRTDIEIDYVDGVNGTRIPLRAEPDHGRRTDIETNKPFSALVKRGTRMTL